MAPRKKVVYDVSTGIVTVEGIKHDDLRIAQQAIDGVVYDPDQGIFRFADDAFNKDWLANNKVQLVVKQ